MEEAKQLQIPKASSFDKEDEPFNFLLNGQKKMLSPNEIDDFWKRCFLQSLQYISPDFVIDGRNEMLIKELYRWIWARMECKSPGLFNPQKGLLLWGEIGTGKTTLLKGIQRYLAVINSLVYGCNNSSICIEIRSAAEIALRYSSDGMDALNRWTERGISDNLAIDEIGSEEIAKHFGTVCNVVQVILQLRYEQRYNIITLGTTNIDMSQPDEFRRRYGDYILDRTKEMFNIIKVGGESRRK